MIRSVFRLAEYLQGNNGYLLHHEIYLYIFDALLMFITMVTFNVVHPCEVGRLLRSTVNYELTHRPETCANKPYESSLVR